MTCKEIERLTDGGNSRGGGRETGIGLNKGSRVLE